MALRHLRIDYEADRLILPQYPFPLRKTRILRPEDIVENLTWISPALRITGGEFLCVAYDEKEALAQWCAEHDIASNRRYDAWSDLLDPFLDTEFSPEDRQRTLDRLAAAGLDVRTVAALRGRVEKPMINVTVWSWEWIYYGLHDVLRAMQPRIWPRRKGWLCFYDEAMAVAAKGCDKASTPPAPP